MKDIDPIVKAPKDRGLNTLQKLGRAVGAGLLLLPLTACTPGENAPSPSTSQIDTPTPGASETTEAPTEFIPGATGQYAPDALAALSNNPEALVNVFRITGTTPEEIAENTQKALIGFLMSGTTETDLSKYRVNGSISGPAGVEYINRVGDGYEAAACEGMNGESCNFRADVKNLHDIILSIYSTNHINATSADLPPDFMLGADAISDVKVTDGSMKSGTVTIQYDMHSSNNYIGSAAEKIVNNIKGIDDDAAAKYSSVQNWSGHRRITQTYQRSGDHWVITHSGATERITD